MRQKGDIYDKVYFVLFSPFRPPKSTLKGHNNVKIHSMLNPRNTDTFLYDKLLMWQNQICSLDNKSQPDLSSTFFGWKAGIQFQRLATEEVMEVAGPSSGQTSVRIMFSQRNHSCPHVGRWLIACGNGPSFPHVRPCVALLRPPSLQKWHSLFYLSLYMPFFFSIYPAFLQLVYSIHYCCSYYFRMAPWQMCQGQPLNAPNQMEK